MGSLAFDLPNRRFIQAAGTEEHTQLRDSDGTRRAGGEEDWRSDADAGADTGELEWMAPLTRGGWRGSAKSMPMRTSADATQ